MHKLSSVLCNYLANGIAGDFNAHLGSLAGLRGHGSPNERGLVLKEFIDRNNLFVASHSQLSTGPPYTYHSGERFSTIDYIITKLIELPVATSYQQIADQIILSMCLTISPSLPPYN